MLRGTHKTGVQAAVDVQGFLFVPGWTFLGATYDAVIVQPFVMQSVGSPINRASESGMFNTYIVPVELSWKLGTSGFVVKTGLGIYVPDGTIQGAVWPCATSAQSVLDFPARIVPFVSGGWLEPDRRHVLRKSIRPTPSPTTRPATFSMRTSPLPRPSASGRSVRSPTTSAQVTDDIARPALYLHRDGWALAGTAQRFQSVRPRRSGGI